MTRDEAKQWVMDGERACLPPNTPLPFTAVTSIISARKRCVVAVVEMFDGRPGTIEVSQQEIGGFKSWGLYWKDLPGGSANWNGSQWERVNRTIQPKQADTTMVTNGITQQKFSVSVHRRSVRYDDTTTSSAGAR